MGIYFRKRIKILPGVNINIGKRETSVSVGPKGAKVNIGKRGTYLSTGIPGTGIYFREKISGNKKNDLKQKELNREVQNKAINENPLRFMVMFFSLWLSIMLPLFTGASWWTFPILSIGGITIGVLIPNKKNKEEEYDRERIEHEENSRKSDIAPNVNVNELDKTVMDIAYFVVSEDCPSISQIKKKFGLSYVKASEVMDILERNGIVSHFSSTQGRKVLISINAFNKLKNNFNI